MQICDEPLKCMCIYFEDRLSNYCVKRACNPQKLSDIDTLVRIQLEVLSKWRTLGPQAHRSGSWGGGSALHLLLALFQVLSSPIFGSCQSP